MDIERESCIGLIINTRKSIRCYENYNNVLSTVSLIRCWRIIITLENVWLFQLHCTKRLTLSITLYKTFDSFNYNVQNVWLFQLSCTKCLTLSITLYKTFDSFNYIVQNVWLVRLHCTKRLTLSITLYKTFDSFNYIV